MSRQPRSRVSDLLGDAQDVLVLTTPMMTEHAIRHLVFPSGTEVYSLTSAVPRPREHDAVVLAVRDLVDLRRSITGVPNVGAARRVLVWFERPVTRLPSVVLHPQWPPLEEQIASRSPDHVVLLSFATPLQVRPVLLEIARAAAPSGRLAVGWPSLGLRRDVPEQWPPADPSAKVALLPRLVSQSSDSPPDLMLLGRDAADRPDLPHEDHPVLGRPSRVTIIEPDLTWEQWTDLPPGDKGRALDARGVYSLGAVDEQLINPIGFDREPGGGVAPLTSESGCGLTVADRAGAALRFDPRHGLSEVDLPALRELEGVRLDWSGGQGPQDYCRVVAGLAAAGVPLVTDRIPDWAGHLLPPDLVDALARPVDLSDRLRREEHSVLLRRAALRCFGSHPWRRRLAQAHGLQHVRDRPVSILLATRRPDMLPFALAQVARQRGAEVEVVLATHGFDPDPRTLDAFRESCPTPVVTVHAETSVSFGEVLNRAASVATGDLLLKMDDDDWYGPDFVSDLVLAHGYSGAQVVGCAPEFTFLEELSLTTRWATPTEAYRSFLAGGTLLIDRSAFRSLGGFRHTVKYVDANLLSGMTAAGGSVYRTHGLGYVLRRRGDGHTWDPGLGYFLTAERAADQWRGFRPSALLDARPEDDPVGTAASVEQR